MKNKFMDILDAVENHKGYSAKSLTTYYGVKGDALKEYQRTHKDNLSRKALKDLTKAEAKKVAVNYLNLLANKINQQTNSNFSTLDEEVQDGVLMMAYNTGLGTKAKPRMQNTIQAIKDNISKYHIMDAMLHNEKNSNQFSTNNVKKGYLNRLYVSVKMMAGRAYEDFDTRAKLDKLYQLWDTRNETDSMRNSISIIKQSLAQSNEQSMQESNAFVAVDNQEPSKNELQAVSKQNNTNTAKPTQKTQEEEDRGLIDSFISSFTGLFNRFTNKQKNSNINTTGDRNDGNTNNNLQ